MPIAYRRNDGLTDHVRADLAEQSILLFDPVMERYARTSASESIGDRVRALDPAVRDVDLVVLRGSGEAFLHEVQADAILPKVLADKPTVALVGGDVPDRPIAPVRLPTLRAPEKMPPAEILRQVEIEGICIRSGALFKNPHFHYQLPSGLHAEGFIRLGDALHDPVDITRIADWVLPILARDGLLLADTGSILSLIQEIARRMPVSFDCLERYPPNRVGIERRIEDLRRRGKMNEPLNFLVSVTSSGRLLSLVEEITQGQANLVTVVDASMVGSKTPGHVLARMPIQRWAVNDRGSCSECANRQLMPIAAHSYECSPGLNWHPTALVHTNAVADRPFWQAVDATGAVSLHVSRPHFRDGQSRRRHFGVFLDIQKLVRHEEFREACREKLRRLRPPDLVLIPNHECARVVERLIKEIFSAPAVHFLDSARLDENARSAVRSASHVLIADDAIVSGATLSGLRVAVYRATQDMACPPTLHAFAIVARPAQESDLKAVMRPYRSDEGNQLTYGAKVYLPEACPWCEEKELLGRVFDHLSEESKGVANERIQRFDGPLTAPFLLGLRHEQVGNVVTRRSFFGDLSHVTAFASCASAVQALRNGFRTYQSGGIVDVVDLPMVLEAYFETVFPSAVLRTSDRAQLWNPNKHNELGRDIERIDIAQAYPGMVTELALAAAFNKVPQNAVLRLIDRALTSGHDPHLVLMKEVINLNLG